MTHRITQLFLTLLVILLLTGCSMSDVKEYISSKTPHSEGYTESLQTVNEYADAVSSAQTKYRRVIKNAEDAKDGKTKSREYLRSQVDTIKEFIVCLAEIKEKRMSAINIVSTHRDEFTDKENSELDELCNKADAEYNQMLLLKLDDYEEEADAESAESNEAANDESHTANRGKLVIVIAVIVLLVVLVGYVMHSQTGASQKAVPLYNVSPAQSAQNIQVSQTRYIRTRKYREVEKYCDSVSLSTEQFIQQNGGIDNALNVVRNNTNTV